MNVTPLVDVMLVLLIIFMIAVPALTHPIEIDFTPPPDARIVTPDPLRLRIEAGGTFSLDGQAITLEQMKARFAAEAARGIVGTRIEPRRQPALELVIEPDAEYEMVAKVMSRAKNANLMRIGFAD